MVSHAPNYSTIVWHLANYATPNSGACSSTRSRRGVADLLLVTSDTSQQATPANKRHQPTVTPVPKRRGQRDHRRRSRGFTSGRGGGWTRGWLGHWTSGRRRVALRLPRRRGKGGRTGCSADAE